MSAFILVVVFVLSLQTNFVVTLGIEHMVIALIASVVIWVGIKLEETGLNVLNNEVALQGESL